MPLPPLLADANISPRVVSFLRDRGVDVLALVEMGLAHLADDEILFMATASGRFVLTHDADFGRSAMDEVGSSGVLYLRPGDQPSQRVIDTAMSGGVQSTSASRGGHPRPPHRPTPPRVVPSFGRPRVL